MAEHKIVISIFENEAAADAAVVALKEAGIAEVDAVGVLTLDDNGEVKTEKVGSHSAGKGAAIGLALGLLGPVGVGIGLGVGMGATTGAVVGLLHHKNLGLDDADRDRIAGEIGNGKAAVGVLADADEADGIESMLTELGGASETHPVDDEAVDAAVAAAAPATA